MTNTTDIAPNTLIHSLDKLYQKIAFSLQLGHWRYIIAVVLCLIALKLRLAIAPEEAGLQFVTFFPAVALTAVLYGMGPGLLATVVCAFLSAFYLFKPYETFVFQFLPDTLLAIFVFCADGVVVSLSVGMMHRYFSNYHQAYSELEEALHQKQQQEAELIYQKFALDQHAIVAVTDVRGTINYVNEQFCAISQYTQEELLGQNHRLLNSGTHPKAFFTEMYRTIAQGTVWKGDICNRAKDGNLYWVATTIVPYNDDAGKPIRYVAIRADITERKKAEQAAQAATLAKSQFLANMSHEIRTPMNAILGLTRVVMESDLKPEQREQLAKVRKSGQALIRIINDILDFSRIEAGRMALENISFRLETLLLDVSDLFGAQVEEKGLEMFIDIHHDTPLMLMGDPLRLTQIINNLVDNAIKFTKHGEIHLGVKPVKRSDASVTLQFSVRDTGMGMSAEVLESLFEPFVQTDNTTTRKFGGSGLGLSIVKKLASLMQGEVHVESSPGTGAMFIFTVEMAVVPEEIRSLSHFGNDLQQLHGKRVLVVDDQPTSRHILAKLLNFWGLRAVAAESGPEALVRVEDAKREGDPFHAVLLDWRMPGMDGLEVAVRLKSGRPEYQTLKVLMLTAYDKQALNEAPEAVYIDGILTKPVVPSLLFDALLTGTGRSKEAAPLVTRRFDGMHVLLVEDHDMNQEVAANFLRKRGVSVSVAWHGGEALEAVKREVFDLVLMDLHMPVMGGIEATQLIRQLPQGRELPIVAMTAAVLTEDQQICSDVGMNDFIPKPVEPEDLVRVLSRFAPAHKQGAPNCTETSIASEANITINLIAGLRRLDGDLALQQRLLLSFIERYHDIDKRLDNLLNEKNISTAIDLIHTLKGIAGNLGAVALTKCCSRLIEEMRNDVPLLSRAEFVATLIETLNQMQVYIGKTTVTPAETSAEVVSDGSLQETLQALAPYILGQEVVPDVLLSALQRRLKMDQECSAELGQLQYHLDNFQHAEAKEIFNQLHSQYA